MVKKIAHIGLTVSDIEKSISFYRDVLGLTYVGRLTMEGKETDELFNRPCSKCFVAYLNCPEALNGPSIELIQFVDQNIKKDTADLFKTSISEICFETNDIKKDYLRMNKLGVKFLSGPKNFDFTNDGFGKSKALYFKDPDGIILELMEY